jgi:ribose transport system substrate-binding protein
MKKLLALAAVVTSLTVFMLGIGSLNSEAADIKVGFVAIDMTADSINSAYQSFEEKAKEYGWEINLANCQGSVATMSSNMINMISWGANAIVVSGGEATVIQEGVDAASQAGIPVFLQDTENIGDTVLNVTSNGWAMGAFLASMAVDRIKSSHKEKESYNVMIMGNLDLFVHRQRIAMYEAVINEPSNRNINIVGIEAINPTDWAGSSYDIARTYLTKYGKDLDCILATWDGLSWGVSRAILDAGYTKDDVFTMGIDGSPKSFDLIKAGEPLVGVVAQDFPGWSLATAEAVRKELMTDEPRESFIPPSRTIYIPYKWVDETNVADFKK